MKKGLPSFLFDVDFFSDSKIQFVNARFGVKGEIITIRLLALIYRQGYYITWNDDEALLLAKSVGDNISPALVSGVVEELLKRDFFSEILFTRFGILTSNGIQTRYFDACKRRNEIEVYKEYLLITNSRKYNNLHVLTLSTPSNSECIHSVNISNENVNISEENDDIQTISKVSKVSRVSKVSKAVVGENSIFVEYAKNGFGMISATTAELIQSDIDEYSEEWCKEAMRASINSNVRKWSYVNAILKRWGSEYDKTAKPWELSKGGKRGQAERRSGKNRTASDGSEVDWENSPDHF